MEEKKKISNSTETRNTADFSQLTGNIYETVAMLAKRANQIAITEKKAIKHCIEEYAQNIDTMDEVCENREQIERIRQFEVKPKPTLAATEEYLNHQLQYRNPSKEDQRQRHMQELEDQVIAEKENK